MTTAPDYVEDARGPTVTTYPSKIALHPFDPHPSEIRLIDIAHHLSLVCRFGGGCSEFYSVAQHSVKVYQLTRLLEVGALEVPVSVREELQLTEKVPPDWEAIHKLALLHDAEEYIFGDMTAPVKSRCPDYKAHALRFRTAIFQKYGVVERDDYWRIVKYADRMMRRVEEHLLDKEVFEPFDIEIPFFHEAHGLVGVVWTSSQAANAFLNLAWDRFVEPSRPVLKDA